MIVSPCISICKTDPSTGCCYGCGRNNEKKGFGNLRKQQMIGKENLNEIEKKLTGWQLEICKESYYYKINSVISLSKKKLSQRIKYYEQS